MGTLRSGACFQSRQVGDTIFMKTAQQRKMGQLGRGVHFLLLLALLLGQGLMLGQGGTAAHAAPASPAAKTPVPVEPADPGTGNPLPPGVAPSAPATIVSNTLSSPVAVPGDTLTFTYTI